VLASGLRTRWTANTIQRDPAWRRGRGPHCELNISTADAKRLGIIQSLIATCRLHGVDVYTYLVDVLQRVSLHPAGHVLGSAQVRVERRGRVWVASGDYFVSGIDDDVNATCAPFEPVRCECFITESTFGLPIYRWRAQRAVQRDINTWWQANADAGRASLLLGYSFGKAQRLLAGLDPSIGPIVAHGAVEPLNAAYRAAGVMLPPTRAIDELSRADTRRAIALAPPAVQGSAWARRLGDDASDAFASGWMQLRGARRRQGVDRGFVLSDHADWPGLQRAIAATGAERVIVTHGYEAVMVRALQQQGLQAESFATVYGDDAIEAGGADAAPSATT